MHVCVLLQVRQTPSVDGIVCGNLSRGMVLQCWAVMGDWVQLRYHQFACVWALQRSGERDLLVRLDESVQRSLLPQLAGSPCLVPLARVQLAELIAEVVDEDDDEDRSVDSLEM